MCWEQSVQSTTDLFIVREAVKTVVIKETLFFLIYIHDFTSESVLWTKAFVQPALGFPRGRKAKCGLWCTRVDMLLFFFLHYIHSFASDGVHWRRPIVKSALGFYSGREAMRTFLCVGDREHILWRCLARHVEAAPRRDRWGKVHTLPEGFVELTAWLWETIRPVNIII